jgi:predicted Zn-dependent peptidase
MKTTYDEKRGYRIHLYKTDKFKQTTIKISLKEPIKKENITKRSLLYNVLFSSSKKYNSERKINIRKEELYSMNLQFLNNRIGNYLNTTLTIKSLDEKYTEKGILEQSISLLSDLLLDPLIEDNHFKKDKVDLYKEKMKTRLSTLKEDAPLYAAIRAKEVYDDSVLSYRVIGYIEDIDPLNEYNLYEYYKEMIKTNIIDFYVVGNIELEEIESYINKYFSKLFNNSNNPDNYELNTKITNEKSYTETINNEQSILIILSKLDKPTYYERYYVSSFLSYILGGGTSSKLFNIIREQESLCYYINSNYRMFDNVLSINSGIDNTNYKKAVKLIKKIIKDIQNGNISEEEINNCKTLINNDFDAIDENAASIINYMIDVDTLKLDELDKRREKINKVTKEEIVNLSKKIKIQNIYLLEGVKND